jgi:DNA (cytosine-5)-methyltransferase 1
MREIARIPWNGLNVASTFSGGGGSCTGYRMAGYRVLYANEFIEEARSTYRANHPASHLDSRDIRQVSSAEILENARLGAGELDILDGSPPCSSFSMAGKRATTWGKAKAYSDGAQQVTDDLFFEYCRLLDGLQPKVFIAENVAGLIRGEAKGYFKLILAALRTAGYHVAVQLLDAQWLGVPQVRQRLIFIGVRRDLGRLPVFPQPLPYRYSVRDALPGILAAYRDHRGIFGGGAPCTDTPAPTVLADSVGTHWIRDDVSSSRRKITIAELQRVCSFPEDYVLTGTYAQQWERIGRSVPPLMMRAISGTVRDRILSPQ